MLNFKGYSKQITIICFLMLVIYNCGPNEEDVYNAHWQIRSYFKNNKFTMIEEFKKGFLKKIEGDKKLISLFNKEYLEYLNNHYKTYDISVIERNKIQLLCLQLDIKSLKKGDWTINRKKRVVEEIKRIETSLKETQEVDVIINSDKTLVEKIQIIDGIEFNSPYSNKYIKEKIIPLKKKHFEQNNPIEIMSSKIFKVKTSMQPNMTLLYHEPQLEAVIKNNSNHVVTSILFKFKRLDSKGNEVAIYASGIIGIHLIPKTSKSFKMKIKELQSNTILPPFTIFKIKDLIVSKVQFANNKKISRFSEQEHIDFDSDYWNF